MKSFSDPSFFRLIYLLVEESHTDKSLAQWTRGNVQWLRIHNSFTGPACGFGINQYQLTLSGRKGWTLLVVKENWWSTMSDKNFRSNQWAKLLDGKRGDVWEWLHEQEKRLML